MKIILNKSTKRALSLVLALAMLVGSLFTANVGISISADAATDAVIWTYSGTPATSIKNDSDSSSADNPIMLTSAEEIALLANGTISTAGKYYAVPEEVDAIVLQPSYTDEIMALTSAEKTQEFFADDSKSFKNWVNAAWNTDNPFCGSFDGNGVTIYGLYNNYPTSASYVGLFSVADMGADIKNLTITNSYMLNGHGKSSTTSTGWARYAGHLGAIIGFTEATGAGLKATGDVKITNCEVYNCYLESRAWDSSSRAGVMVGLSNDYTFIDNCLVYDNIAVNTAITNPDGKTGFELSLFGGTASKTETNDAGETVVQKYVTDSVILDTTPYPQYNYAYALMSNNGAPFSNVYTNTATGYVTCYSSYQFNCTVYTDSEGNTVDAGTDGAIFGQTVKNWAEVGHYAAKYIDGLNSISDESVKGALGKLAMNLDWAVDGDTENGKWYAIDGEYPTLFKPEGWTDCETIKPWDGTAADEFAGGSGTEEAPYLIETPEQLWAMVLSGGKVDGKPAYYKVKDGVKNLYLSKAISGGYAAAKSLASGTDGTDYHNWNTGAWTVFEGNFDGNGVTIRGMISKSTDNNKYVGLIHVIGEDAVVKNVNFDTCYAYNSSANYAGLLASQVIYLANEDADSAQSADTGGTKDGYNLIYNVSVRNSSIQSKSGTNCGGLVVAADGYPDMLQAVNCLYDGYTCELGNGTTDGSNSNAGIVAFSWGINNAQFSGCVSLGAPIASNRSGTDKNYNDYRTGKDGAQYTSASGEKSYVCHPVYTINCYTDIKETTNTTAVELVDENGASLVKAATADETLINNMPLLDWANGWYVATDADGRKVPMPRVRTAADVVATWDTGEAVLTYNVLVGTADGGAGSEPYNGRYGRFDMFVGSGTEADPYIISTPLELARAIGAGGVNLNHKLYFRLSNDIDVSGMPWIDTVGSVLRNGKFTYVPFEGILDGDGHTVTGLYAVSNDGAAGLIPVMASTGIVKNLHIRNSYIGSSAQYQPYKEVTDDFGTATEIDAENPVNNTNTAGAIAGIAAEGAQIIGCSVENTTVINTSDNGLVGNNKGLIENSYIIDANSTANNIIATYYDAGTHDENGNLTASGAVVAADGITVDYGTAGVTDPVWYIGGAEGSVPRLVNRAAAMAEVDVAGDDNTDYDGSDLVALRNKLLRKSKFQNIYGDVSKDGVVNSSDLVILRRAMVTDYHDVQDGFWRNVELGNVDIYYGENDNYDAARKLELYFESLYDIEVIKHTANDKMTLHGADTIKTPDGTVDSKVDIVVGNIADTDYATNTLATDANTYAIGYDASTYTLWLQGENFTAVEQAVLDFIKNNVVSGDPYTQASKTLSAEKLPVTVGNTTYYYAWGDEFPETESKTISGDNWHMSSYRAENEENTENGKYNADSVNYNKENPNLDDLNALWVVDGGKLTIWRGVNTSSDTIKNTSTDYSWGYKGLDLGVSTDTVTVTNDWGKPIDSADAYIDPGLITTKNSMLFKQGYVEMEASLPSDGHAFPAWWFLTYTEETNNNNIASSLYGKVFKENSFWDNSTKAIPTTPTTYKYQVPTAHLEFDIVELMQTQDKYNDNGDYKTSLTISDPVLTGNWLTNYSLTVHKLYKESVYDGAVYAIDWDTLESKQIYSSFDNFNSTQGADTWSHRYNETKFVTSGGETIGSTTISSSNGDIDMGSLSNLTGTHKYGFAWTVDESNGTYSVTVYVDDEKVTTINQNAGHSVTDYITTEGKDAELWNQYAYMLLDNGFYSANKYGTGTKLSREYIWSTWNVTSQTAENYEDLLSQETANNDKATFIVSYVRVYQENDKRDIVTRETEAFNNGNHFGY